MDCCGCVQGSKMFKDLCKRLCHYEFHTLYGVTKFCVVFVFIFCISSDCTLMLGIVDLCWLGFVGKVRSEGLEGRARAPQSKPDSPILGMSFSAPQQNSKA